MSGDEGKGGDAAPEGSGGLSDVVELRYLEPGDCAFAWSPGGFLSLRQGGAEYPRVSLHRAFPFTFPREQVSVRDGEGKEIGMLASLDAFPADTVALLERELDRRYFVPAVLEVRKLEEEFGYSYWDTVTDAGPRRFTVKGGHNHVHALPDGRVLIQDVDGNRFVIRDASALDGRTAKLLENMVG